MQGRSNDGSNGNSGNGVNGTPNADDTLHIGDRVFRKSKLGLDEKEVRSYIEALISERDALVKRQEHLSALAELAEKTVIEANNLALQMKQKAADQAKAEADKIRVKAEQDIEKFVKEKKAEAKAAAEKEAEAVRAEARKQVEVVREEQITVLKTEAKDFAQKVQTDILTTIDNVRKHVMSLGEQFEQASSLNFASSRTASAGIADKVAPAFTVGEKAMSFDQIPWLEVEVLPPVDIGKIMDLISYLEGLPVVKTTDLLPEMPNPFIRVFLNEPAPLAELLQTLPQVEKVIEMSDSSATAGFDIHTGGKREKIQIVLGKNPNATKDKESKKGTVARVI
ncbi:MAG TPA: hypothetical protein VGA85_03115 [Dehalococcoidales bacterium]